MTKGKIRKYCKPVVPNVGPLPHREAIWFLRALRLT